ncbi:hypothetical protein DIPPA_21490 [Diplonema papillatum]|nr:hypothetical protein DIPPA_21490 [Diplonema papillatum]
MEQTFQGQHIFITGATGFVGKVLIEKILYSLPVVDKLYIMVREKQGITGMERLQKEVVDSPVMQRCREKYGEEGLKEMCKEKFVPIVGSLEKPLLGMTREDYDLLVQKCTTIMHLAATIDFNERLDNAVTLNVLGTLQILSLARKCHARSKGGFDAFVHCSTCYVNYPRHGKTVEEVMYPIPFDAEVITKNILNMSEAELTEKTPQLLKKYGYPNTYTFTKRITEHLLNQNRGSVPMCITRPSIIGSSVVEPFPGWIDTLSACGGLFLTSAFGLTTHIHANSTLKADVVPVDYVSRGMLIAAAKLIRDTRAEAAAFHVTSQSSPAIGESQQQQQSVLSAARLMQGPLPLTVKNLEKASGNNTAFERPTLGMAMDDAKSVTTSVSVLERERSAKPMPIYHFCTSGGQNNVDYKTLSVVVPEFWQRNPPPGPRIGNGQVQIRMIKSRAIWESRFFFERVLPSQLYYLYSRLPFPSARPEAVKRADRLKKATAKAYDLIVQFRPFDNFEWFFMPTQGLQLQEILSPSEYSDWSTDHHDICWSSYFEHYCIGLVRYVVKQEDFSADVSKKSGAFLYAQAHL